MIRSIEAILVDVPTIRPHKLSVATMHTQTLVLVQVRCEDGIEGWGEATTIGGLNYGEESPESIKVNIDTHIAPLLIGMEARNVAAAMARVRKTIQGNRFAKCALETALLDAQARRLGVPLSELLGGRARCVCSRATAEAARNRARAHAACSRQPNEASASTNVCGRPSPRKPADAPIPPRWSARRSRWPMRCSTTTTWASPPS